MLRPASTLALFFITMFVSVFVSANDKWTQWGGSQKDFSVQDVSISNKPELTEKWRRDLGTGYSAILCEDNRLYTMYRQANDELIVCLDRSNGKTVWEMKYPAPLSKDADESFGKGPNSTPILVGDFLICIGFNSDVHCVNKISGEVVWKKNLIKDHGGTSVDFGYSASPLLYKDNLILPVGGKGAALMAFSVKDGSVAWSALDYPNSYGNPLLVSDRGFDQVVFATTDKVVAADPADGSELWTFPLTNQWDTHAFSPLWVAKNHILFVSSFQQSHGLGIWAEGATKGNDSSFTFSKEWSAERSGIGFTNAVAIKNMIFGSTGGTRSPLVTAFDSTNGKVLWKERGFAKSNFLAVGEHLLFLDGKGEFVVAKPDEKGLNVIFQKKVLSAEKVWTVPTLVGNTLFMRDQKEIVAMEIK